MSNDGTKQGASRRYIMSAVEASLTRLKTDYIDLYQQHDYDPLTPIEETLRALDDLVRQGKVRYIGNSNFPAWRIAEAELIARAMNVNPFVSCQDEYSLVVRDIEKDLLPAAQEYKLGLLPFFPLASGLLTGKYKRGAAAPADTRFAKAPALRDRYVTPRNEDIVEKLQAFAQGARPHHARAGVLMAGVAAASLERDRRRHPRRAGRAERQGDRLDAERGGDRGDRRDYEVGLSFRGASKHANPECCEIPRCAIAHLRFALRAPRNDVPTCHPTSPFIGFTGALSGNTVSASTRSARPR